MTVDCSTAPCFLGVFHLVQRCDDAARAEHAPSRARLSGKANGSQTSGHVSEDIMSVEELGVRKVAMAAMGLVEVNGSRLWTAEGVGEVKANRVRSSTRLEAYTRLAASGSNR